jgi:hypothetical protein
MSAVFACGCPEGPHLSQSPLNACYRSLLPGGDASCTRGGLHSHRSRVRFPQALCSRVPCSRSYEATGSRRPRAIRTDWCCSSFAECLFQRGGYPRHAGRNPHERHSHVPFRHGARAEAIRGCVPTVSLALLKPTAPPPSLSLALQRGHPRPPSPAVQLLQSPPRHHFQLLACVLGGVGVARLQGAWLIFSRRPGQPALQDAFTGD